MNLELTYWSVELSATAAKVDEKPAAGDERTELDSDSNWSCLVSKPSFDKYFSSYEFTKSSGFEITLYSPDPWTKRMPGN